MQPTQEAVAWAERADAWAQRPPEGDRSSLQPQSRWSEIAATGRPAFPADGVGWRTETAEWRATEQTARWRQTTEWRSASGTHGWRSTTEAWQTGAGAEEFRPPVDPPTGRQAAISGTAWPTPEGDQPSGGVFDAAETSTDDGPGPGSWRRSSTSAPAWQPPADPIPAWQQFAASPAPWEQPPTGAPWQTGANGDHAPRTTGPAPTTGAGRAWNTTADPGDRLPPADRLSPTDREPRGTVADREDRITGVDWETRSPSNGHDARSPGVDHPPGAAGAGERNAAWGQPAAGSSWDQPGAGPLGEQTRTPAGGRPWRQADSAPWQQADPAPWRPADPASRQQPPDRAPWHQADPPPWQQADPASRQQPADPALWQQADPPPWQQADPASRPRSADPAPWQQPDPASGQQQPSGLAGRPSRPSWQRLVEPEAGTSAYDGGMDAGRHLVREDDRARWRRDIAGAEGDARPGGRRRAPEPGSRTSAGTGWRTRADADNWAGHADTGSIQMFDDSVVTDAPAWGARSEAPTWRRPGTETPSRQTSGPGAIGRRGDSDDRDDDTRGRRQAGAAPLAWQDDDRGTPPRRAGGRRRAEGDRPSWGESAPAADGREATATGRWDDPVRPGSRAASDRPDGTAESGRRIDEAPTGRPDRAARESPRWQHSAPAAIGWQGADDDDDRWDRRDDGRRQDPPAWRRQDERDDREVRGRRPVDPDGDGWEDTGSIAGDRRRAAAPADPWAYTAADTGVIPFSGEPPAIDADSWRSTTGSVGRARPANPHRRRDDDIDDEPRTGDPGSRTGDPSGRVGETSSRLGETTRRIGRRRAEEDDDSVDPAVWRREPDARTSGANWPVEEQPADWRRELRAAAEPPVGEAVTEVRRRIDPAAGLPDRDHTTRGTASYREADTGDWRRELAADSGELTDGDSRRFGTQDFVPFRPVGSASVAPAPAPVSAPAGSVPRREQLLVRYEPDSAPEEAPEQWPPRRPTGYQGPAANYPGAATGAYERRPVGGGLATAPGRPSDLLEPDDDEFEEDTGGPLAAVGYTVVWYGVPVVLFVLYMLVLNGSQQAQALSTLAEAAPQFGLSLVLSMVVAVGLRWASGSWKAVSVGLAAAVMGGGLATVLASAITGNSLS